MPDQDEQHRNQTAEDLVQVCRRLYDAIDRLDTQAAALVNVSRNDLRCLNLLAKAPMKPSQIGKELGLTSGSITSLLDRLEKGNLIRRGRDPDDRRGIIVHPTKHLFETVGPLYRSTVTKLQETAATYTQSELDDAVRYLSDAANAYEGSKG
ncbi:MAG: MarR family winged helix-turn-helix transcriptional regulator [Paracoccaceae bacterium]